MHYRLSPLLVVALTLGGALDAAAQLRAELFVSGLTHPVAFVQDPSNSAVQYVVQQEGMVRTIRNGSLLATPFLNLSAAITAGGERGLLGMAMAPDYATSGRFFVNFTNPAGHTVVARFTRSSGDPLVADPASRFDLLWSNGERLIRQPFANHNGGNMAFGPDGYLYIGMGDGGSGNDPQNNAQTMTNLLGKMLRIDVSVPSTHPAGFVIPPNNPFASSVAPEIWNVGLRNPWRWSFDDPAHGGTGALVIGDVGQNLWEEVDYEPAGKGGRNYGWRIREGAHDNVTTLPPAFLPLVEPIFEYPHPTGNSISGGYVYRGTRLGHSMRGRYFFADFVSGKIWSIALAIDPSTGEATAFNLRDHTPQLVTGNVSSFGTDAAGELYFCHWNTGTIYRIGVVSTPTAPFMHIDTPGDGASATEPLLLAGWALDAEATADAGIDAIHVWAYPLSQAGDVVFAGTATLGGARPDLADAFGGPQFGHSGFSLIVRGLPPATYRFVAYGLVHATNRFDVVTTVDVTITPGVRVAVDVPAAGGTVDPAFVVSGWAIDVSALAGTGIDAVHVWALHASGQIVFLGATGTFASRDDVGAVFGPQFTQSGYTIQAIVPQSGSWLVLVYARSTVDGNFRAAAPVPITVR